VHVSSHPALKNARNTVFLARGAWSIFIEFGWSGRIERACVHCILPRDFREASSLGKECLDYVQRFSGGRSSAAKARRAIWNIRRIKVGCNFSRTEHNLESYEHNGVDFL
jgi:hypothetical protein